jgi:hypothetical protein
VRPGLVILAALAFLGLRAWGLDAGSPPVLPHPDEHHYAGVAQNMPPGEWNPHYFLNPPLLTYALVVARRAAALLTGADPLGHGGELYMLARWIGVVLGALTAFTTAAAARRLVGGAGAAWAAALVVGLSFLHGRDSHYGVNDVPMVFLVSLALLGAARYLAGGRARALAWSAACAGLATATKYNGAIAVLLPVAALLLRPREGGAAPGPPRARPPLLLGLPLLSALCFLLGNPYALLAPGEFLDGVRAQYADWGDQRMWGQSPDPVPLLYAHATLAMLGWAHAAAAAIGIAVLARSRPRAALLLAVFPAAYLAGMFSKSLFFWRFALPLLPFLAIAAAAGWQALAGALAGARAPSRPAAARTTAEDSPAAAGARAAPVLLLLLLPLLGSVEPAARLARHDQLVTRDATWLLARRWLLDNARWGDRLFLEGYPPLFPPGHFRQYPVRGALDRLHQIVETQPDGTRVHPVDEGGWVVTDGLHELASRTEPDAARRADFYRRLRETLPLAAGFPPSARGRPEPRFVLDAMYGPLVDLWSMQRPGQTVRIYRLDRRAWRKVMAP